ncbi:hypothetical protein A2480_03065 [Candidatus Uhrbacteria bacterium RIFOXYC2_FULL_47_19]|uniref:Uncharacterized protein n=1 Tax=Candidatus Uhrbacteria bacterium RIFOXYC2_FULL_47_19 TaxID=1802424 RepID=A0A1F7WF07_9BACT|nr:MAG: hypothetical protein A2480_03065 [Candidatus Uhrbacteria bacterium RIFOXYC2_FULL_47_19]HCC22342.1 hypothetical protein [Candidatus Uhrbacteria bacterium]
MALAVGIYLLGRISVPDSLTERLENMVALESGDVRSMTEQALILLEMASKGPELFLFNGGTFNPYTLMK